MRIPLFVLALGASGCATMFGGNATQVPVSSTPPGVTVVVDGKPAGTTPCTITLQRKTKGKIDFTYQGETRTVQVDKSFDNWGILNFVSPVFVGFFIDALLDNWSRFREDAIFVDFTKTTTGQTPAVK